MGIAMREFFVKAFLGAALTYGARPPHEAHIYTVLMSILPILYL